MNLRYTPQSFCLSQVSLMLNFIQNKKFVKLKKQTLFETKNNFETEWRKSKLKNNLKPKKCLKLFQFQKYFQFKFFSSSNFSVSNIIFLFQKLFNWNKTYGSTVSTDTAAAGRSRSLNRTVCRSDQSWSLSPPCSNLVPSARPTRSHESVNFSTHPYSETPGT